jgi:hypothetical protein
MFKILKEIRLGICPGKTFMMWSEIETQAHSKSMNRKGHQNQAINQCDREGSHSAMPSRDPERTHDDHSTVRSFEFVADGRLLFTGMIRE